MSDFYYDPAEPDDLLIETYEESDDFERDAWEAAIDQQPAHLTPSIVEWYRGTGDYLTALSDIRDGERTIA